MYAKEKVKENSNVIDIINFYKSFFFFFFELQFFTKVELTYLHVLILIWFITYITLLFIINNLLS